MNRRTRLFQWMVSHPATTFAVLVMAFVLFGLLSLNVISYLAANATYLLDNGLHGLMDGGFAQLLMLWAEISIALAAYVLFKTCEHALIERLAHGR